LSYTNITQVRRHLALPFGVSEQITDVPVTLGDDGYTAFHGGAVDATTVVVKSVHSGQPSRVTATPVGGGLSFSTGPVVAGSVVVASDSSLGTIYAENVDYVVNCVEGTLTFKDGGNLVEGAPLTVWYLPYTIYSAGADYQLRDKPGEIRRLSGGGIAAGETVLLDFNPVYLSLTDEIVSHAVNLANRLVENEVDAEGLFEADPMLGAAATFKALETVCRAAAGHELAGLRGSDRTATAWMKLADDYAAKAETLLKAFRPPFDSPRSPATS